MTSGVPTRSLILIVAWLLYACGSAPTAPESEGITSEIETGAVESGEAIQTPDDAPTIDALLGWALESDDTTPDHDARIAHAILERIEDRKEIVP